MSAASRRIADARAAGSPGGTSRALWPSTRSSRAAAVSAVMTGARARERLEDLVRDHTGRLAPAPKMPSAQPACRIRLRKFAVLDPRNVLDVGGRPRGEQRPQLAAPRRSERNSGTSRAAARIVSSPWSGISFPTNRTSKTRGASGAGGNTGPPPRRTRRRRLRGPGRTSRSTRRATSVSATRGRRRRNDAPVEPRGGRRASGDLLETRPRSSTRVSANGTERVEDDGFAVGDAPRGGPCPRDPGTRRR